MNKLQAVIPQQLRDRLERAHKKTGLNFSDIVRRALEEYLIKIEQAAG